MGAVGALEWACVLCGHCIQNDWVEQGICIRFCVKPPQKLFGWFRLQLWATGDWQPDHNMHHISHAEFFYETSNHPCDSDPLQLRFGAPQLVTFPKTKIIFEREEISDHRWDSGNRDRAADGNWENCVRSQVPILQGTKASSSYVQCFLYLVQ